MQKIQVILLSIALCSGCSWFKFPGLYKIDVQQGNIVTQEMVDQLRPGMNRHQVQFIMGTPLIKDSFHKDRWDYLYSIQPGGKERSQERLTLFFQDDKLTNFSGDFVPGAAANTAEESQNSTSEEQQSEDAD